MASKIEIVNRALVKLGEQRITSIDDTSKRATVMKDLWDTERDSELRKRRWSFSIRRASLPADSEAPEFGYAVQYSLPADCLRILSIGEYDLTADLSDYTGRIGGIYTVEGRKILTDSGFAEASGALRLRYIARIEDTTQWDATFVQAFACKLAVEAAEPITQSAQRRDLAWSEYRIALNEATRANAIELPPQAIADDTWVLARNR